MGIAHILHQIGGGRAMMSFWYHFAIMPEALFIFLGGRRRHPRGPLPSSPTRAGQRLPKFRTRPGMWAPGDYTARRRRLPGALCSSGVTDPRGGIQTLYPLFGIASSSRPWPAGHRHGRAQATRSGVDPAIPAITLINKRRSPSWRRGRRSSPDDLLRGLLPSSIATPWLQTLTDPAGIEEQRASRNTS